MHERFGRDGEIVAEGRYVQVFGSEGSLATYGLKIIPAIKDLIREQAGHRCQRCGHPYRKGEHGNGEWSPCDAQCRHGGPLRVWKIADAAALAPTQAGDVVIVEIDNASPDWTDPQWAGFTVEAQWRILTVHHLDEDKTHCRWFNLVALCQRCHLRMQRAVVMGRPYHFEHSEWFKPYAAGFYAFKYLGEDLTREETMARLDELLALEHRWTQEALL
jgi:hypothetical protein